MFDAEGNIHAANRSAEALFGHDADELARRNLAELFAPESQHGVFEYLAGIKASGVESLLDHGREVLARESKGGIIALSMTMGRTRPDGPNFFAVFRDLSQAKQTESELREARRLAERAANAKADVLARISHEVRTPLNAIIGFSEVMIGERFGALGNERYLEYMKDIRASGERVIAIVNDLLDLSRIETGKLDLAFTNQNLNELVESCVAVLQPQANRERIIIRTSLAHMLPPVIADAQALRQITLNLIGNSIHLANAGGQVIVSTALSDFGEVMLRVRDTGNGLNDNEVAAALQPFRTQAPSDRAESSAVSLSLTKALVEANRAKFQIKTGGRSGTLIEIVFPHAVARRRRAVARRSPRYWREKRWNAAAIAAQIIGHRCDDFDDSRSCRHALPPLQKVLASHWSCRPPCGHRTAGPYRTRYRQRNIRRRETRGRQARAPSFGKNQQRPRARASRRDRLAYSRAASI